MTVAVEPKKILPYQSLGSSSTETVSLICLRSKARKFSAPSKECEEGNQAPASLNQNTGRNSLRGKESEVGFSLSR